MTEPISKRDIALRHMFVSLADAAPFGATRRRRKNRAIAIVALLLGGAVAGTAVSTAAFAATAQTQAALPNATKALLADVARMAVGTHGKLLGNPVSYTGTKSTNLKLGTAPAGADHIVIAFQCELGGTYAALLNAVPVPDSADICYVQKGESSGVNSRELSVSGGTQTLSIRTNGKPYGMWASWVNESPIPDATDDQLNAVADGKVTRAEYLAAWNGYLGCMAGKGFAISNVSQSANGITGGAFPDEAYDADRVCYPLEYETVMSKWFGEHLADQKADPNWTNELYEADK